MSTHFYKQDKFSLFSESARCALVEFNQELSEFMTERVTEVDDGKVVMSFADTEAHLRKMFHRFMAGMFPNQLYIYLYPIGTVTDYGDL